MAKRLKAPIDFIITRILGEWDKDCEWSQERFRTSVEQHPCEANTAIVKAMDSDNDDYLMLTIEHLIHLRCDLYFCDKLIYKAREIDWRT